MGITPLTFTGVSKFSEDFQTILKRASSIATLPVLGLQKDQQDITARKVALTDLASTVGQLASSLGALSDLADQKSLTSTSSNTFLATATAGTTAQPGTYTLSAITSLASIASSVSDPYADAASTPVAGGSYLQLAVGDMTYDLNLAAATNNLNGIRDAINSKNAGVTATIITTGDAGNPQYRLSISSNSTGNNAIELRTTAGDTGTNILPTMDPGANAEFKINGQSVVRKTNTVTGVVPGVTLNLTRKTADSETVTITVASDRTALSNKLTSFVNGYNALVQKLDLQTGKDAGALRGDASVREVRQVLREMIGTSGDSIALADLGISLDNNGQMVFDSDAISDLSADRLNDAFSLLGKSGIGSAASKLEALSDPSNGLFEKQQDDYDKTLDSLSTQINAINDRATAMQSTLQAKLQAADVLLAGLERQQDLLTASVQSMNLALFGKSKE